MFFAVAKLLGWVGNQTVTLFWPYASSLNRNITLSDYQYLSPKPLDSVLVRLQTQPKVAGISTGGVRSAVRALVAAGGSKAFWSGSSPMLWSVPVQNALLFSGYGAGLGWCGRREGGEGASDPSLWHVFVGGCAGGFAQSFVMSPVELLKVRLQLQGGLVGPASSGASTLAANLVSESGLRILSRGLSATLGRDVLPHGVWFASYEGVKQKLSRIEEVSSAENGQLSVHSQLTAGAFAATTAWLVGYPFDVIKTRMQGPNLTSGPGTLQEVEKSLSLLFIAREMYQAEGIEVFWRGFGLKLVRAVPMSMIGFFAYEKVAQELRYYT